MANPGLYNRTQGDAANAIAGYFGGSTTAKPTTPDPAKMPSAQLDAWKQKARSALANAFTQPPAAASPTQPAPAAMPAQG